MKATVAVAVAGLCAGVVHATTIAPRTTSAQGLSSEANARNTTHTTALGAITMTLGATYELNDELTLTLSGTNSPTFGTTDGTFICSTGGDVWTALPSASTTTTRVFRFAPSDSTSAPTGALCTAGNLHILDASVGSTAGNTVSLRVSGRKISAAGAAYNTEGSAAVIATVFDDYIVGVSTALNGSVDARKSNKIYTDGTTDALVFTVTNLALLNSLAPPNSTNALTVTLAGDFSFLINSGETATTGYTGGANAATVGADPTSFATIGSGTTITGLRLTIDDDNLPANGNTTTFGITFAGTDASTSNAITAQSFAGDATYSLAFARGSAETGTLSAGEWTSNGARIFVPYMPISSSIVPTLYWINNSTASGTVFMTVRGEGSVACGNTATVAITRGMTSLSTAFNSLVASCQPAAIDSVDKVFITLTGTTPIGSSEVYSAFTVGGSSRVTVVNSSSGYKGNAPTSGAANTAGVDNADNNQR